MFQKVKLLGNKTINDKYEGKFLLLGDGKGQTKEKKRTINTRTKNKKK
jgi:hypothetical protein